ncbi:MAG: hypothetical protein GC181_09360 [Bacteroidetes bacterium]|nr:hypothetical protein [Bacteroidota bacterium]
MNKTQTELWKRIQDFDPDDPDSEFSFSDRLCRENDWKLEFAIRAIDEYKKFMFLICLGEGPLTPSDEIDQVWHLHLLYTESYWNEWCRNTLGREIHHGPTTGGTESRENYTNLYNKTLDLYENVFKTKPPSDIWPPDEKRFRDIHFTRVNRHKYWLIPKLFRRKQ